VDGLRSSSVRVSQRSATFRKVASVPVLEPCSISATSLLSAVSAWRFVPRTVRLT